MEESQKRIVEIDGIKLEIDLRTAKKIEHYRIGDNVRVLVPDYSSKYKICPGVIVGFDEFEKLPTLIITYLELGYNSAEVKFAYINNGDKESKIDIAPAYDLQELHFRKSDVNSIMLKEIAKKEEEVLDLKRKKEYFDRHFAKYFEKKETA